MHTQTKAVELQQNHLAGIKKKHC